MSDSLERINPILPSGNKSFTWLSDVASDSKPWDVHRSEALDLETVYFNATIEWIRRYSDRIKDCSEVLEFGWKPDKETGEVKLKLARASFCRVRHCPVCQWRRSMKWQARMLEAIPLIKKDYPSYRWIFLTLTVKNCEVSELRETLNAMNKGFARLSQLKSYPGKGWVKCIEVTKSTEAMAHPHIHCLILVSSAYFGGSYYLNQSEWVKLWKKSCRLDYNPVVDVRVIKPKQGKSDIESAIAETLKYTVKPSDMIEDGPWLYELTNQLHKTRAVSIGGILRQYLMATEPEPEEEPDNDNPGGQYFYWHGNKRRYGSRAPRT